MQARRPGKMEMERLSTLVVLLHVLDCSFDEIGGVARKGAVISLDGQYARPLGLTQYFEESIII